MRSVLQRVSRASVVVDGETVGAIERGILVLVGVENGDGSEAADRLAEKLATLRIFADDAGKMNRNAEQAGGGFLVVSQFTLAGQPLARGRRPSFDAAPPAVAEPLVDRVVDRLRQAGQAVATGRFGADMKVELVNDGPVTFVLET
ncbi:MAG: D-aminoacyl-tRNA deacylase [Acidobacteriota bacterium]